MTLTTLEAFAHELADAAAAEILPRFRAGAAVENKASAGFDPVTAADRAAEAAMRALIERRFPEHGLIGEEFGEKPSASPFTWVLDPIDGTRAFLCGLPLWGVLIGLLQDGAPVLGIIDQPYLGERYVGASGAAYSLIGGQRRALQVRPCPLLSDAVLATTDPFLFAESEQAAFEFIRRAAKLTRYGTDCYAYARLAAGDIDLVIEAGLKIYDVAALAPVIAGAGGRLSDWRGQPALSGQIIAAGDANVRAEALIALRRAAS